MAIVRDAIQQCMSQLESLSPGLTTTEFNPEKNNPFEIDSSINDEEYEKIITMRSVHIISSIIYRRFLIYIKISNMKWVFILPCGELLFNQFSPDSDKTRQ